MATSRFTSCDSAASQRTKSTFASVVSSAARSTSESEDSLPLRDARATKDAPCCASQRAVSSPMPAVPPVRACPPRSCRPARMLPVTRTTIFPVFRPRCRQRKASSTWLTISKLFSGRLVAVPDPMRLASRVSTEFAQSGSLAMSASSAITPYADADVAAECLPELHTARFPISPKSPPSPSVAKDADVKSSERELRTECKRAPSRSRCTPCANALPSRELRAPLTPSRLSCACLCALPALPMTRDTPNQCAYSRAFRPTPPVVACTSTRSPERSRLLLCAMCTVLQVTGSVHACSNDSAAGNGAISGARARAVEAKAA